MNKMLITYTITCLSLSSALYASEGIANRRRSHSAPATLKPKAYGPCGICRKDQPPITKYWLHPFGNGAHGRCLKAISGIEKSTVKKLEYMPIIKDHDERYHAIHRLAIMFVNKFCYPETIAYFIETGKKQELKIFFSHATDLAMHAYLEDKTSLQNPCGICGSNKLPATKYWTHPHGNYAHSACLKSISKIENVTIKTLEPTINVRFGNTNFYHEMHRSVIMFVAKLCFPETIESYIQSGRERELERYFSCAAVCTHLNYANKMSTSM